MNFVRYADGRIKFWQDLLGLLNAGRLDDVRTTLLEKSAHAQADLDRSIAQKARVTQDGKGEEARRSMRNTAKRAAARVRAWTRLFELLQQGNAEAVRRALQEKVGQAIRDRQNLLREMTLRGGQKKRSTTPTKNVTPTDWTDLPLNARPHPLAKEAWHPADCRCSSCRAMEDEL